ncbi:MAG: M16 family metallopeptidase [Flavobacteriales bacterium]|jgi:zinc protease
MRILIALSLLFSLSILRAQVDRSIMPKPATPAQIQLPETEMWRTKNGMIVILSENHKLPKVSFDLTLGYNPGLEGAKAGINELTGSLIMSGTKSRSKDQLDKEIDFIGASLSASATNISLSTLTKHLDKGLALMSDLTMNASFPESEFKRVVDQFKSGLVSLKSEGGAMANNATVKVNFPNHPYGEVTTFTSLAAISLADVQLYYKENFTPQGAFLVIVGDINRTQAEKYIDTYFGSWTGGVPSQPQFTDPQKSDGNQVYFVNKPGAVQSVIHVTFPLSMRMGNPDMLKISVLNDVFGGSGFGTRLMQNLREDKAFTYGCYSGLNTQNNGGWITVSGNFRNDVTDSAIREIVNELNRLVAEEIKTEELELTKAVKNGSFARSLERPQTIARFAYNIQKYGMPNDYYKTYLKQLNDITTEDLKKISQTYLKPNNFNIIVVGNESVLDKIAAFDSDGNVVKLDEFGDVKMDKKPSDLSLDALLTQIVLNTTGTGNLEAAKKKISKVKTLVQKSSMTTEQIPFPLQNVSIYTNKGIKAEKVEVQGNVAQKQYFNGKEGYQFSMQTGKKSLSAIEIEMESTEMGVVPELLWLTSVKKPELRGIEMENGAYYYVLKFTFGSEAEVYYYYEKNSLQKAKTVRVMNKDGESQTAITTYSDFKEVNGIKFPHKSIANLGPLTLNITVDTLTINGKVDLKEFEQKD